MNTDQRRRFEKLLNIQSKSRDQERMMEFMHDALEDAGMTVRRRDGQLYAIKGSQDSPVPFYVAHADTVHRIVPDSWYAVGYYTDPDTNDRLYYGFDPLTEVDRGVGGDDKCGLFVCMEAAREMENLGVIITRDEEIGALGAGCVRATDLANAAVLIQADRRGNRDAIRSTFGSTVISSVEWQDHVQESLTVHGYSWCDSGLFTDVTRMHELGIARVSAVNLSAGYYDPHLPSEFISQYDVEWALALAIDLGHMSAGRKWRHEHVQPRYDYSYGNSWQRRRNGTYAITRNWDEENEDDLYAKEEVEGTEYHWTDERGHVHISSIDAEDYDAIWDGRTRDYVLCEFPACDEEAWVMDNETALWMCGPHMDLFGVLAEEDQRELAREVKLGVFGEMTARFMVAELESTHAT